MKMRNIPQVISLGSFGDPYKVASSSSGGQIQEHVGDNNLVAYGLIQKRKDGLIVAKAASYMIVPAGDAVSAFESGEGLL